MFGVEMRLVFRYVWKIIFLVDVPLSLLRKEVFCSQTLPGAVCKLLTNVYFLLIRTSRTKKSYVRLLRSIEKYVAPNFLLDLHFND